MLTLAIKTLIVLVMGHALGDFALQSPDMARQKNRNRPPDLSKVPPGQSYAPTWPYWLTAHALIHGLIVYLLTKNIALGVAETACHWMIDFGKCEAWYNIGADQSMHLACKILWALLSVGH